MNHLAWSHGTEEPNPSRPAAQSGPRQVETLIIGGGPSGCAAAIKLAEAGHRPELIERSAGPHDVVCGGFLGWDALAALRTLGLDPAALGARPIERLRLVVGKNKVEARLPHVAAGLSRRCLDQALIERALSAGAIVTRGRTAKAVEAGVVRLDDDSRIKAKSLFLATGKHELRGLARPLQNWHRPLSVGLRSRLPPDPSRTTGLEGYIELHLFEGGYAGLLLQEDGSTNVCLSVASHRVAESGGPEQLVEHLASRSPRLADRLAGANPDWQAIARVPYGWRAKYGASGQFRLGDQAAVIASLAGDGIAIALTSGLSAAKAWIAGGAASGSDYQQDFAARAASPLFVAERLRGLAETQWGSRVLQGVMAGIPGSARAAALMTRI